ncbi:MAG TPA: cache domain-containing protein [Anaeromyxobacter sp.]|nr:cache domain-containing protein [Anaeromyxobacter sp.]
MKKIALAAAVLLLPALTLADDYATTKDAELMVHRAVQFLRKEGREKALAAFSDPQGKFTYRDLYIMVYDVNGKCVAHGQKKERIGKNLLDDKDAGGKAFVRERIEIAKKHGKGWQDYKFQNPVTGKVELKTSYFEREGDLIVGCGAYKK